MSRVLDAAIAEALGYEVERQYHKKESYTGHRSDLLYEWKVRQFDGGGYKWYGLSYYSTNGNAMLELDKEMRRQSYEICSMECIALPFVNRNKWKVAYRKPDHLDYDVFKSEANTEPLARALAAYKALTGKDWEGEGR